jgi:hypothetical protein
MNVMRSNNGTYPQDVCVASYKFACLKLHEDASFGGFEAYHKVLEQKMSTAKTIQNCEAYMFNRISLKDTGSSCTPGSALSSN